ncbi:GntR family transcriptional regulator [Paenibacillus tyrfis]|uniref:GntR family transcriptional regulator n=1 Tax=Paenibacillus tyrfis TaxID=1501230 RepID=UPI0020A00A8D|nr:GntR family transcriptional regulator [Paenibacillus tyrfis]MCP1309087.1 GntR family transcriptional regulator [Paenibacillus tyrfis]
MKLNNESSNPLYVQLKQMIKEEIHRGTYKPGQQLPSESDLCDIYEVSRITARRAILDLVDEGILQRKQGKGTFVKEFKIERELLAADGFSEFIMTSGETPKSQILSCGTVKANAELAHYLNVPADEPLLRLKRLLYVNDDPFFIDTTHYPLSLFPALEQYITESVSTYEILKRRYDIVPTSNAKVLNVIYATQAEAELLKCEQGAALFDIFKLAFDAGNRPIHTSTLQLPAHKATFTINSSALPNAGGKKVQPKHT